MSPTRSILVFFKILIFRGDNLENAKKNKNILYFTPQKDEYSIVLNFGFEKKVDKNLVFFMKNVAKTFINSVIDRQFYYKLFSTLKFETCF